MQIEINDSLRKVITRPNKRILQLYMCVCMCVCVCLCINACVSAYMCTLR